MSELAEFLSPLPEVGEPVWIAPGVVKVDDYTFDVETIADAAVDEARYVASILAAKRFLDEAWVEDRRERALKAAKIALDNFETQFPSDYKSQFAPDTNSPFYKMADAILAAIDDGEL
jgi:hypothetical protein